MGFFKKLLGAFSPAKAIAQDAHMVYVRCNRCHEYLSTRIFLNRDLSEQDDDGYVARKLLSGSGRNRCFEQIEVVLYFDQKKQVIDQQITGGTFVSAEDYQANQEPDEQK